jgi:hypothetical protein
MPAAALLAVLLTGCGLREDSVYPQYALNSDQYFSDRRACIQEAYKGGDGIREAWWSPERFSVCMQVRGWRNP